MDKSKRTARSPSPSDRPTIPQSPLAWFHSAPSTQIGVYKALFPIGGQPVSFVDELGAMQNPTPEGRKWAMFMTAGGHFAGAIVRVSQAEEDREDDVIVSGKHKSKPKRPKPETEVLKHKTFHRYTSEFPQTDPYFLYPGCFSSPSQAGWLPVSKRQCKGPSQKCWRPTSSLWRTSFAGCK